MTGTIVKTGPLLFGFDPSPGPKPGATRRVGARRARARVSTLTRTKAGCDSFRSWSTRRRSTGFNPHPDQSRVRPWQQRGAIRSLLFQPSPGPKPGATKLYPLRQGAGEPVQPSPGPKPVRLKDYGAEAILKAFQPSPGPKPGATCGQVAGAQILVQPSPGPKPGATSRLGGPHVPPRVSTLTRTKAGCDAMPLSSAFQSRQFQPSPGPKPGATVHHDTIGDSLVSTLTRTKAGCDAVNRNQSAADVVSTLTRTKAGCDAKPGKLHYPQRKFQPSPGPKPGVFQLSRT